MEADLKLWMVEWLRDHGTWDNVPVHLGAGGSVVDEAIASAIEATLATPEQEVVAWELVVPTHTALGPVKSLRYDTDVILNEERGDELRPLTYITQEEET